MATTAVAASLPTIIAPRVAPSTCANETATVRKELARVRRSRSPFLPTSSGTAERLARWKTSEDTDMPKLAT
ncbi:MAG: hypothetical protein C4551_07100 [Bacillota bacterium]|nr:MAG: hypothetical protein C4551_07100 [Bacillota bacterium]